MTRVQPTSVSPKGLGSYWEVTTAGGEAGQCRMDPVGQHFFHHEAESAWEQCGRRGKRI